MYSECDSRLRLAPRQPRSIQVTQSKVLRIGALGSAQGPGTSCSLVRKCWHCVCSQQLMAEYHSEKPVVIYCELPVE